MKNTFKAMFEIAQKHEEASDTRGKLAALNSMYDLVSFSPDAVLDLVRAYNAQNAALQKARSELGVPQPGYPAPVAEAAHHIKRGLEESSSILDGDL
jgi:hypothetical protein